jgi:RNA polymerase sigma-70 factor (ECF subfamily)
MSCHPPTTLAFEEPMPNTPDPASGVAALVDAARGGDGEAIETLYARVRPRLLRIALALGADPDDAADLVQETLWSAHRSLDRFDETRASFEGWLGTILIRRSRNRWRAISRGRRLLNAIAASTRTSSEAGSRAVEARLTLRSLLDRLGVRQREVIALYEIDGLSAEEVAGILGITAGGVRSIARDARRRLAGEQTRGKREVQP